VEPLAARLIHGHRCVDEFIQVPKGWMKSFRCMADLRRRLQSRQFDCVLDPQSLTKSSLLGWLSGAPRRVGFRAPRGREFSPWLNTDLIDGGEMHLVDATLRLLSPLGIWKPAVRFEVPQDRGADLRMEGFVTQTHLGRGFVTINCAASCAARRWPPARFGRVARFLGENFDLPSVVTWAGPEEEQLAEHIVAAAGGHALAAPDTSLAELAALQRRARLMIGSDTGPLHLAAAVGTPCLGLYGPTDAGRSGPYGSGHYTVEVESPRLRGRRRRRDDSAMLKIAVEDVCEAAAELLRQQADRPRPHRDAA
jgi:ADP-heptose:LPS heptosyltransferase